ncbi:hypothetical protein BN1200_540027 [Klebsiella variicola]|nr:hypothetical protein BN1200_540027 [Klebsiella variicola]
MDLRHRKLMSGLCSLNFHDWLLEWGSDWRLRNILIIIKFISKFNIIFVMRTNAIEAKLTWPF